MKYNVIFVTMLFLFGCSTAENRDAVQKKHSEVMEIHDIAMEKMGEMAKLKKELKSNLNSDSTNAEKLQIAIENLEIADKVMWDWMHNYHQEIVDTSNVEAALKYLEKQYGDVKVVEEKINTSLKNGKDLL